MLTGEGHTPSDAPTVTGVTETVASLEGNVGDVARELRIR